MNAKICDRCGSIWRDEKECTTQIHYLILSKGHSHSDKIRDFDLCDKCYTGLFDYLKPIPIVEEYEDGGTKNHQP